MLTAVYWPKIYGDGIWSRVVFTTNFIAFLLSFGGLIAREYAMMGGTVRVVSTTRKVPALTVNGRYQVFIRQGKEFILDWYGGYVPVTVKPAVYKMVQKKFEVDKEVEKVLTFKPLPFLEGFLERHSRRLVAKPRRELEKTIQMLRIAEGKE